MEKGTEQLALGRNFAFKLMIVVTDGYGNTLKNGGRCDNDAQACNQALSAEITNLYNKLGGPSKVATYAVGVAADRDVFKDQLRIVAGGRDDRVLHRKDFAELASNNVELIARACDENPSPCGGCCGFCSCGKCQAVDTCVPVSPCTPSAVPAGGLCCADVPTDCSNPPNANPCNQYTCDNNPNSPTAGKCIVNSTVNCGQPFDQTCFNRSCDSTTGLCKTVPLGSCGPVKECTSDAGCAIDDKCAVGKCLPDGACNWTRVDCVAQLGPGDKCNILSCSPSQGCLLTPIPPGTCNDNNNCTIDSCDPIQGCVYVNRTDCNDGKACTVDTCDPINGCQFVPVVCPSNGSNPCAVTYCETDNGTCAVRAVPCTYAFPTEAIIAGGIGAAAIVGIVVAAVLLAAGVAGGGAYAYANANAAGAASGVSNNPLYVGVGTQGSNPLYKA
jgi:hypothetical protein